MKGTTITGKMGIIKFRDGRLMNSILYYPEGLCSDRQGNLLVADFLGNRIRRIDVRSGIVTTVAGSETSGFQDGDALIEAKFRSPDSLVVRNDSIYVSDGCNDAIRKVEMGRVTTLVTGFRCSRGIASYADGGILVTDYLGNCIKRVNSNGGWDPPFPRLIPIPQELRYRPIGSFTFPPWTGGSFVGMVTIGMW